MKHTPLFIRIAGGALLTALLLVSCLQPMLTRGESAALAALSHRGKPYVFGARGPESYDCSGLVLDVCAPFGVDLIHSAQFIAYDDQYQTIEAPADLIPGDLVFFDTVADRDQCDHVGVWLGLNRFVHASSSEKRVMISSFDADWRARYSWSKRVLPADPLSSLRLLLNAIEYAPASKA